MTPSQHCRLSPKLIPMMRRPIINWGWHSKEGNLESAESEWREAVRLASRYVEAQRALAVLAMRKGDMSALEQAAAQVINLQPGSHGYALRALSDINRKQFRAAQTTSAKPSNWPPGAAWLCSARKFEARAKTIWRCRTAFQEALDRDPTRPTRSAAL